VPQLELPHSKYGIALIYILATAEASQVNLASVLMESDMDIRADKDEYCLDEA